MPVQTTTPAVTLRQMALPPLPRITTIRADRLSVGDHILHCGTASRIVRLSRGARIELLLQQVNQLESGDTIKLRAETAVQRIAA